MLYIMESQLASLLLKPRRPISCLCMSGCGPHPRHHTEPRSTRTRPPDDVNGASSWAMSSSRRYHRERERETEREEGGSRQAWSCSLRVLVGFHELDDDREMRREQAHSPGTDNGVRRTVKAIFRQSFLLVPRIRYQRTTVAPCPHTVFHQGAEFSAKIFVRFVSTFYYYPSVNVRIVCENLN